MGRRGKPFYYSVFLLWERRNGIDLILECVCVRERKVAHIWEIHIFPHKISFPFLCEGMPNWMAGGGVG